MKKEYFGKGEQTFMIKLSNQPKNWTCIFVSFSWNQILDMYCAQYIVFQVLTMNSTSSLKRFVEWNTRNRIACLRLQ